jgi:hypothetical protein
MAVHTLVRFLDHRRVISLEVEPSRKVQNRLGAKLYTIAAPFASVVEEADALGIESPRISGALQKSCYLGKRFPFKG